MPSSAMAPRARATCSKPSSGPAVVQCLGGRVFCQNNQWGISTPSRSSPRFALSPRARFRDFRVRVDGNDVLAVYEVTSGPSTRRAYGGGPTLIDGLHLPHRRTHTSDDPPTRYRIDAEVEVWKHA